MPAFDSAHPYWLPEEFSYLNRTLAKYTEDTCSPIDDAYRLADKADSIQLTELAAAYRMIVDRDHVHSLSALAARQYDVFSTGWKKWCEVAESHTAKDLPVPLELEPQYRPRVMQLFYVFDRLARKGLPPFNTREVEYSPPPIRLEWSKLPEELSYLAEPAFKYGQVQFEDDRSRFASRIDPQIHAELKAVADRFRSSGHGRIVDEWFDKYSPGDHREAALVKWMLTNVNEIIPELSDHEQSKLGLDWSKLPREFGFLRRYAELYGRYATTEARALLMQEFQTEHADVIRQNSAAGRILKWFTGSASDQPPLSVEETRYSRLLHLAEITDRRSRRRARRWAERFPPSEHRESALILSLLALLDEHFDAPIL